MVNESRRDAEKHSARRSRRSRPSSRIRKPSLPGSSRRAKAATSILTDEDHETIERFRAPMLGVRRELRDNIKLAMRQDVDRLDAALQVRRRRRRASGDRARGAIGLAVMRRRSDRAARTGGSLK